MFCENIVTLVRWMCKSYSTFGLFNMYFWFVQYVLFFFNHRFVLFFLIIFKSANARTVFLCCTSSVFALYIYSAILLSCFFFFLLLKFWTVPSCFNQLCWAKIHYSTYNFFGLTFCIFFSLHTILSKNT